MKKNFLYKSFVTRLIFLSLLCTNITLYVSPMMRRGARPAPSDPLVQALNILKGKLLELAGKLTQSSAGRMPPPGPARHPAGPASSVGPVRHIPVAPLADVPESTKAQLQALSSKYEISLDRSLLDTIGTKGSSIPDSEIVNTLLACDYLNQTLVWDFMTPINNISQLPALRQTLVQQTIGRSKSQTAEQQRQFGSMTADDVQILLDAQETPPDLVSRSGVKYLERMCGWYALYFAQVFEQTTFGSRGRLARLNRREEFEHILPTDINNDLNEETITHELNTRSLNRTITWAKSFKIYTYFKKYIDKNQSDYQPVFNFKSSVSDKFVFILFLFPSEESIGHWITVCAERADSGHVVMTIADSYGKDHREHPEITNWYRYLSEPVSYEEPL